MIHGTSIVAWQRKLLMKPWSKQWKSAALSQLQRHFFFFLPKADIADSKKCVIIQVTAVICMIWERISELSLNWSGRWMFLLWKTIQNQFVHFGSKLALFSSSLISLMIQPCYMFLISRISHFFAILAAFGHFYMWGDFIIFVLKITRLLKTTFFITENIIFHASLVQTREIIAKKTGQNFHVLIFAKC